MRVKRKHAVLGTLAIISLLLGAEALDSWRQPVYGSLRVGEWFHELAANRDGASDLGGCAYRWTVADDAFRYMDSNAVPFLVSKLNRQSALQDKIIMRGRSVPIIGLACRWMIPPTHERLYAAAALRMMGTNAASGIPSLLRAYAEEQEPDVRDQLLQALDAILGPQDKSLVRNWEDYESRVMARLRDLHPELRHQSTDSSVSGIQ